SERDFRGRGPWVSPFRVPGAGRSAGVVDQDRRGGELVGENADPGHRDRVAQQHPHPWPVAPGACEGGAESEPGLRSPGGGGSGMGAQRKASTTTVISPNQNNRAYDRVFAMYTSSAASSRGRPSTL